MSIEIFNGVRFVSEYDDLSALKTWLSVAPHRDRISEIKHHLNTIHISLRDSAPPKKHSEINSAIDTWILNNSDILPRTAVIEGQKLTLNWWPDWISMVLPCEQTGEERASEEFTVLAVDAAKTAMLLSNNWLQGIQTIENTGSMDIHSALENLSEQFVEETEYIGYPCIEKDDIEELILDDFLTVVFLIRKGDQCGISSKVVDELQQFSFNLEKNGGIPDLKIILSRHDPHVLVTPVSHAEILVVDKFVDVILDGLRDILYSNIQDFNILLRNLIDYSKDAED